MKTPEQWKLASLGFVHFTEFIEEIQKEAYNQAINDTSILDINIIEDENGDIYISKIDIEKLRK